MAITTKAVVDFEFAGVVGNTSKSPTHVDIISQVMRGKPTEAFSKIPGWETRDVLMIVKPGWDIQEEGASSFAHGCPPSLIDMIGWAR